MPKNIVIEPVTRIEGHAKITIFLDDDGRVKDAHFHVTQHRGFEKFCEGRRFTEMPSITARICGICPVSHLIASAKACDQILAVEIPDTAKKLRSIINMAQIVQSHALSFFYLSSPDLLLGMDSDPAKRNIVGVLETNPEIARDGVRLRKFSQQVIELLAGKRIHPAWIVPGGVNAPLLPETRDFILAQIPDMLTIIQRSLGWFKQAIEKYREEIRTFANFPTMFMALVDEHGGPEFYDGKHRVVDASGEIIADELDPHRYYDYIGEATEAWSYTKFPAYKLAKPLGNGTQGVAHTGAQNGADNGLGNAASLDSSYRVGPLARMNVLSRGGTYWAGQEWAEFRELDRGVVLSSFHYHYARLIEMLYAAERMEQLLKDPDILSQRVRAHAEPNSNEGVGVVEAPRGVLIHHYKIDDQGLIEWANMIVATGHNNSSMNKGVAQVAKHFIKDGDVKEGTVKEGALNRIEAVIRAYDPCLSCSTHAVGKMPMKVELVGTDGNIVKELKRD
ncbi:MAG: Ni/Fe hydrogenase subunit alpha [Rubrobacteridae bacterium]|nr:Ni/Fe hydrogenase subunit alpha [Rubrobacteridae bacterium]